MPTVKYELLSEKGLRGVAPVKSTDGSAGYDLALPDRVVIFPGARVCVPLLIAFDVPEPYYLEVFPRSSTAVRAGVVCPTSIIDTDYKRSVHAILFNTSTEKVYIAAGTRVMQFIVKEKIPVDLVEVSSIPDSGRGGLGST